MAMTKKELIRGILKSIAEETNQYYAHLFKEQGRMQASLKPVEQSFEKIKKDLKIESIEIEKQKTDENKGKQEDPSFSERVAKKVEERLLERKIKKGKAVEADIKKKNADLADVDKKMNFVENILKALDMPTVGTKTSTGSGVYDEKSIKTAIAALEILSIEDCGKKVTELTKAISENKGDVIKSRADVFYKKWSQKLFLLLQKLGVKMGIKPSEKNNFTWSKGAKMLKGVEYHIEQVKPVLNVAKSSSLKIKKIFDDISGSVKNCDISQKRLKELDRENLQMKFNFLTKNLSKNTKEERYATGSKFGVKDSEHKFMTVLEILENAKKDTTGAYDDIIKTMYDAVKAAKEAQEQKQGKGWEKAKRFFGKNS